MANKGTQMVWKTWKQLIMEHKLWFTERKERAGSLAPANSATLVNFYYSQLLKYTSNEMGEIHEYGDL
jgi:hypothetical protein